MLGFKTHFPIKGARTDVIITPFEKHMFAIELESTDPFEADRNPKSETVASQKPPHLIVQKTSTKGWVILDQGSFDLNDEDLQALGRAIENDSEGLV